jgi:hypothetical protein
MATVAEFTCCFCDTNVVEFQYDYCIDCKGGFSKSQQSNGKSHNSTPSIRSDDFVGMGTGTRQSKAVPSKALPSKEVPSKALPSKEVPSIDGISIDSISCVVITRTSKKDPATAKTVRFSDTVTIFCFIKTGDT